MRQFAEEFSIAEIRQQPVALFSLETLITIIMANSSHQTFAKMNLLPPKLGTKLVPKFLGDNNLNYAKIQIS